MIISKERAATLYQQISTDVQRSLGKKLIANVQPCPGDVILDLGCGTGELSAYLAELVGRGGKVVAVDPDISRIKLAQESHGEISNLAIHEGSASNFPGMDSECYDIVLCNFVLHWIQDKQEAFRNMFQSFKPGGKILVSYGDSLAIMFERFFKELIPENCDALLSKWNFVKKSKIEEMCAAVGFDIVKSYDVKNDAYVFKNKEGMISFFWASSHGAFDPQLITKDRLASFCAQYTSGENSSPFKLYPGEGDCYCVLVAAKPV
ncbi:uncharacterized protein LOC111327281 [Stylophora pistillata]|uniref:uncharacterized protein LOC111327281 n=1 Tax=Stylophora pistillata TaxID=50429 RepID=UPI000C05278F|nr:uncharacterized protein LOC111327281 [Stylophora pistillata]